MVFLRLIFFNIISPPQGECKNFAFYNFLDFSIQFILR